MKRKNFTFVYVIMAVIAAFMAIVALLTAVQESKDSNPDTSTRCQPK